MTEARYRTPKGEYRVIDIGIPFGEGETPVDRNYNSGFAVRCDNGFLAHFPTLEEAEDIILMFNRTHDRNKIKEWKE